MYHLVHLSFESIIDKEMRLLICALDIFGVERGCPLSVETTLRTKDNNLVSRK